MRTTKQPFPRPLSPVPEVLPTFSGYLIALMAAVEWRHFDLAPGLTLETEISKDIGQVPVLDRILGSKWGTLSFYY